MSPEQAEGRRVDERSDLFSFGTVLYELLAGTRPFGGDTQADLIAAVLRDTPRPLKSTRPEIPESVTLVIDKCLRKSPAERFRTAADLKAALANASGRRPLDRRQWSSCPSSTPNRDDDGEFFADGVTEDIISALAKLPGSSGRGTELRVPVQGTDGRP
jgi:serine/threonine protein kinase